MTDTPTEQRINDLLAKAYTPEGCRIWWSSPNRNLGFNSPRALFDYGDDDVRARVLAEAERVAGGAW